MRCEIIAIGTELLLGQIVDTNSSWIGEQLATAGIDVHYQVKVGDNHARIVAALYQALARSEAVICCGGLGPTQDDITREAIASVVGVPLVADETVADRIREMFASRGRTMSANNLRQADVPRGASVIPQVRGTAPGLICPLGDRVIYAVPGVPHEMREMITRAVVPDLAARAGTPATIVSRTLRTWGMAESALAELIAPRLEALDSARGPTIAFLASGIEGIKVRITAKAATASEGASLLDAEEAELRALLGRVVFGVDGENMEVTVSRLLVDAGLTLAVAESLTGGLLGARLTAVLGASGWFRGGIISYAAEVKQHLLGIGDVPAVSEESAAAMARGAASLVGADVGLAVTGVAGPTEQDGQPVGTVWVGMSGPWGTET
nr:competence/damage-inducible protein A [Actinomycetota bacterium]